MATGAALASCQAGGLRPVRGKPAPDLPWRLAVNGQVFVMATDTGRQDCLMGVQLGVMGVQLGCKVIWAGLRGCGWGAGTPGRRENVTVLSR